MVYATALLSDTQLDNRENMEEEEESSGMEVVAGVEGSGAMGAAVDILTVVYV